MKKILFVARDFEVGGVQTSLLSLLKKISKCNEFEIDLFVFGKGELISHIPENVSVVYGGRCLELSATAFEKVKKSKKIRDIMLRLLLMFYVRIVGSERFYRNVLKKHIFKKKYDVAISYFNDIPGNYFNQGTNLFVSDYVNADEKLAWIHTDPIKSGFQKEHCEKIYKNFDGIMCVSKAVKEKFDSFLPAYSNKTKVFYNVFDEERICELGQEYVPFENNKKLNIVTVCRVDNASKRIDKMVELCKRLKDEGITQFKWRIVGGGPDLSSNIVRAKELDVSELIEFVGEKKNPYPFVKDSDVFALFSAYEGFPMAVGESIILGTKIVTTEYAAAREQILAEHGVICGSDEDFYVALKSEILGRV